MVIGRQQSTGSGFVIDPEGYIMTNAHVVNGASRVQIVLPADNADGTLKTALSGKTRVIPAQIVGITTELDLALLKVEGLKLPALPLAVYSQVRQGEMVFAFGSPNGLRNTLSHGLVSAVARQVDLIRRRFSSRPMRRSIRATSAALWSRSAGKWSA